MIVQITLANYRSIHTEQTLSFVAERGTRHKDNLIPRPGYRLLKAAALFGANASGKSNFVRAIGEMRDFVRDSATKMNDGDPIVCAQPYRLDPESRSAPSRFEITFVTDGVQYVYGFAATRERVHEEWLRATSEGKRKETVLFERSSSPSTRSMRVKVNDSLDGVMLLLLDRTRDNALMISTAARENVKELLPVYRYLRNKIGVFDMTNPPEGLRRTTAKRCLDDADMFSFVQSILCDADTGIESLSIKPDEAPTTHQWAVPLTEAQKRERENIAPLMQSVSLVRVSTVRRDAHGNLSEFNLDVDDSTGTQRLFGLAGMFYDTLQGSGFVVIDELDASMHPLLTRRLLEMFQSPDANPNGAQLLFTTHDAVLLDSALFRRDQIILAEKRGGASIFYSLADIEPPIRSTESFLRNYLVGRYGGTPHLGPAFDMLTVEGKA